MTIRIPEPVGAQMRYLTAEQKELLIAQRHYHYAKEHGEPNPRDMIHLGLLDAAIKVGSDDAKAIKAALRRKLQSHCGCKAEIGKNYLTKHRVWYRGEILTAYQCHLCNHWLVSSAPPDELSARINEVRAAGGNVPDAHQSLR